MFAMNDSGGKKARVTLFLLTWGVENSNQSSGSSVARLGVRMHRSSFTIKEEGLRMR